MRIPQASKATSQYIVYFRLRPFRYFLGRDRRTRMFVFLKKNFDGLRDGNPWFWEEV